MRTAALCWTQISFSLVAVRKIIIIKFTLFLKSKMCNRSFKTFYWKSWMSTENCSKLSTLWFLFLKGPRNFYNYSKMYFSKWTKLFPHANSSHRPSCHLHSHWSKAMKCSNPFLKDSNASMPSNNSHFINYIFRAEKLYDPSLIMSDTCCKSTSNTAFFMGLETFWHKLTHSLNVKHFSFRKRLIFRESAFVPVMFCTCCEAELEDDAGSVEVEPPPVCKVAAA